jgi:hypothetical protein
MHRRKIKGQKRMAAGVIMLLAAIIFRENIEVAQCTVAISVATIVWGLLSNKEPK